MGTKYTNKDGLSINFGTKESLVQWGQSNAEGVKKVLWCDFSYDALPTFTADVDNDGTDDSFDNTIPFIKEGSAILSATLLVTTDWGGTTPTLTLGLYESDGTVIDADGIDATIAEAALDAGDVVVCDGALVANATKLVTADGYLVGVTGGTATSGSARLVIEYIEPTTKV